MLVLTLLPLIILHFVGALPQEEFLSSRGLENGQFVFKPPTAKRCSRLDVDDVESLPGWPILQQYARSMWGKGDYKITINPPGYKDATATMCVAEPVQVNITGRPHCVEGRKDIPPESRHSNKIKVKQGYTNTGVWNITHVSAASHAEFFSGHFKMPTITQDANRKKLNLKSIKGVGQFINAPYNSFITVASNVTQHGTVLTQVTDKRCIGTILEQQCVIPAQGSIQLLATGYIWFNYKTKRAPVANPKGGKHKRYTVKIEDVLPPAYRSAWIDFNGYMNTTMRSDYYDECRWNFKL
jgi:hypothetical protein